MIVLALDTGLERCSAAVVDGEGVLASASEAMARGHQERLAPRVREVLAEAGVSFAAIHRIGVTVGPGSFTGLRVGLAFAKGLGFALGRPVVASTEVPKGDVVFGDGPSLLPGMPRVLADVVKSRMSGGPGCCPVYTAGGVCSCLRIWLLSSSASDAAATRPVCVCAPMMMR